MTRERLGSLPPCVPPTFLLPPLPPLGPLPLPPFPAPALGHDDRRDARDDPRHLHQMPALISGLLWLLTLLQ